MNTSTADANHLIGTILFFCVLLKHVYFTGFLYPILIINTNCGYKYIQVVKFVALFAQRYKKNEESVQKVKIDN